MKSAARDAAALIDEANAADVDGWGFDWLDGRATEERPPWRYLQKLSERLPLAHRALDLDTGGGEVLAEAPQLAEQQYVTERWAPNLALARERLEPRGVHVLKTDAGAPLPFADRSFDLVTAIHPVDPPWHEIARVLQVGGTYFAQHVGPASAFELIEYFIGATTAEQRSGRDPEIEASRAEEAGLSIQSLQAARLRMEFFDVGAVVWTLRKCVWWVPDFSVERYRDRLHDMDAHIRREGSFVAHSTRHLITAQKR